LSLRSYREHDWIIHPAVEVHAGGWKSDVGTLTRHGWMVELQKNVDNYHDSITLYFRNPNKYMVGKCIISDLHMKQYETQWGAVAYLDEQILVKADMYREMQIPQTALHEVGVGEAYHTSGYHAEFQMYSPSKQETEIIVTPEKVGELLEKIREAQAPRAKEIIHSQHKRDYRKLEARATILAFN